MFAHCTMYDQSQDRFEITVFDDDRKTVANVTVQYGPDPQEMTMSVKMHHDGQNTMLFLGQALEAIDDAIDAIIDEGPDPGYTSYGRQEPNLT